MRQPPLAPESALAEFGPFVRTEADLRHAVHRVPARLVVDARTLPPSQVEAAIPALRRELAVVALYSGDLGLLCRWCDRLLWQDIAGFRWMTAGAVRAGRVLELRVEDARRHRDRWIRVPLGAAGGAEAVLSAARANGLRVSETRIAYLSDPPR
jgi:integrase